MFSPKIAPNEGENKANRAKNKDAGHAGFNASVVTVGRKFADKIVTQKGRQDVACDTDEEPNADVFHAILFGLAGVMIEVS